MVPGTITEHRIDGWEIDPDYAVDDPRYWRVECDVETLPLVDYLNQCKKMYLDPSWFSHIQKVNSWPNVYQWDEHASSKTTVCFFSSCPSIPCELSGCGFEVNLVLITLVGNPQRLYLSRMARFFRPGSLPGSIRKVALGARQKKLAIRYIEI